MKFAAIIGVWQKLARKRKRKEVLLYVLAMLHAKIGLKHAAKGYAQECLEELRKINTHQVENCITGQIKVAGVFIPELLHEGVVCRDMNSLGIKM